MGQLTKKGKDTENREKRLQVTEEAALKNYGLQNTKNYNYGKIYNPE